MSKTKKKTKETVAKPNKNYRKLYFSTENKSFVELKILRYLLARFFTRLFWPQHDSVQLHSDGERKFTGLLVQIFVYTLVGE